jgi:hypothetical protein
MLIGGAEGDRTPDLRIANSLGPPLHALLFSDMQWRKLTILQQVAAIIGPLLLIIP